MSLSAAAAALSLLGASGLVTGPLGQGSFAEPDTSLVLRGPTGRMAEPTVAVSPQDPDLVAVAADPYLDPTRIQVVVSRDGGRTWTPPVTVRPPGFAKSFDPDLAFTRSGDLLISGGASQTGRAFCQPDSAVFLARVRPEWRARPSYELVVPPRRGIYVDRPGLAHDPASGLTAVSWTRSSGRGAECLAVPRRSTTLLAWRRGDGGNFTTLRVPVPKAAAYGSELAVDGPSRVRVAVASWDTAGRQVVSVIGLDLDRGTRYANTIIPAGRRPSLSLGRGFPLNLSVVSIAAVDGRFAIAWTQAKGQRIVSMVATTGAASSSWQVRPGPSGSGTPLLPTIALGPGGTAVLLQANAGPGRLRFALWRLTGNGWTRMKDLGRTSSRDYPELGELLGLGATNAAVMAAVPAGRRPSALRVSVWRPAAAPPVASPASPQPNTNTGVAGKRSTRPSTAPVLLGGLVLTLAGGFAAAVTAGKRRRGSHRRRATELHRLD
jgi:hypothetical protein